MKKVDKNRIIQIRWIYFDVKPTLNVSVLIAFIRTLISWEMLFTQQWMLVEITGAKKRYIRKNIRTLKNPTFSNIIPRAKHVLNTFKLGTLNVRYYIILFFLTFFMLLELDPYILPYIYIYIYIYILIHKQTVSLYHNFSVWLDT